MGYKVRDEQGILHDIAGMPAIDSFISSSSNNPVKNKTIYLALQDKVGKAVTDLVNYWNKSESYSKQEVDALIGSVSSMTIEVVASLPSSGISDTTIYWVGPDQETGLYDQYIHSNNTWIKTGDTSINLGDYLTTSDFNTAIGYYYTKTEINSLIADYYSKVETNALLDDKQDVLTFDNVPTVNSTNPVKSGGIYNSIASKQDIFQVQSLGTATADKLGNIYQYMGADTSTLNHGWFYEVKEVVPATNPATYEWVTVSTQDSVAVDDTTIVRDSSTGVISAVTATNNSLGVVKSGENTQIGLDGSVNVSNVLKETESDPGTASEHIGECYLYKGTTTASWKKGGVYQSIVTQVTPEGTENPSQEGWYVEDDGEYVVTSDTQVESGTDYYTIDWVLISANSTVFNPDDFDVDGDNVSLDVSQRTFTGTRDEWEALNSSEQALYKHVALTDDEVASQTDTDNELADMNNILGAKNLLPNNATTQVLNGITFTVNADGSITANGTANADTWVWIRSYAQGGFYLPIGRYIINGSAPEASDAYNWSVYVVIAGESTNLGTDWGHNTDGVEFENTSASNQLISAIWIRSGAVLNNLLFKPMIRPASIKDDTYVPYSKTNKDLTAEISNFANNALGTSVNIIGYTTYANAYTAPSDGYVRIFCYPINYAFINCLFNNITVMRAIGISDQQGMYISSFVRKGTKIHFTRDALSVAHGADFIPLQ